MMQAKKAIFFIFLTILIDCLGIGIIIPTLPSLIQSLSGESNSVAASYGGWLNFSYAAMSFLFAPVLGGLSDRYGRRPILLISLLGLGLDYIFMAMAPTLIWLFVGRLIAGLCGASFTTASAYIADVSTNENRAKNFGMIGAAFGIGFIIGPALGSLFGSFGDRVPFMAAAAFSLLNFIFGYFILPESLAADHRRAFDWKRANPFGSLKHLAKHKAVLPLIIVLFIINLAGQAMPTIWAFYCIEKFAWTQKMIGLSLAFTGVCVILVQGGLIGLVTKKFGVKRTTFFGLVCNMLGFFLFAMAGEAWMIFVIMFIYAMGGFAYPNMQSILTTKVEANEQGELQGGLTSLISVTSILGPLIMASAFTFFTKDKTGIYFPGIAFLLGGLFTLVSLIISYFALKRMRL